MLILYGRSLNFIIKYFRKGDTCPEKLPELIAYAMKSKIEQNNNLASKKELRDGRKDRKSVDLTSRDAEMEKELGELRKQLNVEQKVNSELKRLMIATLNDELQVLS